MQKFTGRNPLDCVTRTYLRMAPLRILRLNVTRHAPGNETANRVMKLGWNIFFVLVGFFIMAGGIYDFFRINPQSTYVESTYSRYDTRHEHPLSQRIESGESLYPSSRITGAILICVGGGMVWMFWPRGAKKTQ